MENRVVLRKSSVRSKVMITNVRGLNEMIPRETFD